MQKSTFQELLENNERDLYRIRKTYFPLIQKRIITGYNIYLTSLKRQDTGLFLNYLHSDLKAEDLHFKELFEKLIDSSLIAESIVVNDKLVESKEIVEREADYLTKVEWENPLDIKYFTYNAIELERDKAKDLDEVIGESLQYDLVFQVEDFKDLRLLIDIFKKYTSKYKLDNMGRKISKGKIFLPNEEAITNAWDIPLLTYTNKGIKPVDFDDFLRVSQYNIKETIGNKSVIVNTLVRRNAQKLEKILEKMRIEKEQKEKYALRVFVEDYIDA